MIRGIYTPNLVPFDDDGRINEGELRRMVNWLIEKGVSGLYPNGSTGEFIRLSFEERKRVIRIVADEVRGRVPILAGAAEPNVIEILEMCRLCADLGCTAVSITGPYYFKVSQESIEHYFREIARQSPIDILLYNIPQYSNEISLPVVSHLAMDCPRIVGTKDSSRDFPRFLNTLQTIKTQRPDFTCLIGCEEILLPALMMGADGGTIATSGVVPEVIMALYNAFQAGNIDEAKRIQFQLLDLINTMLVGPNFPDGFRAGASLRGFKLGSNRQLLSPKEQVDLAEIRGKIACILTDCGFSEAAGSCRRPEGSTKMTTGLNRADVDAIVREIVLRLKVDR
jgi:2-dehydro-3-deoxy-D-pentonate aldolase